MRYSIGRNPGKSVGLVFLFLLICYVHLYKIGKIPAGLYVDESSIGYDAQLIPETGMDEHGKFYPLFFESLGDYKHPIYVYSATVVFLAGKPSEFSLRLTSGLYFILFLFIFVLLGRFYFKNLFAVQFYLLLAAGFLPYLFTVSRISFELITQVTIFSAHLFFAFHTLEKEKTNYFEALTAGVFSGLLIYAYTTSRLLIPLWFICLALVYFPKKEARVSLGIIFGVTAICILPLLIFIQSNPEFITGRFRTMSYIYDHTPLWKKLKEYIFEYTRYFGFDFLLLSGDPSRRHSTGFGGQIFWTNFFLSLYGLAKIYRGDLYRKDRFIQLILLGIVIAPAAAALTNSGTPHALRSIFLGIFLLLLSGVGFSILLQETRRKFLPITLVFCSLSIECALYLNHYFNEYPHESIEHFGTYGLDEMTVVAGKQDPDQIRFVLDERDQIHGKFYGKMIENQLNIPTVRGPFLDSPGACNIYRSSSKTAKIVPPAKFSKEKGLFTLSCY